MPRSPRPVELVLDVGDGPAPLRHRLADAVVAELRAGRLRPGDALPSTRALAGALGLSRGPVVAAYDELAAAGFVVSRAGSGAVVAPGADRAAAGGALTHVHTPRASDAGPGAVRPEPARWDLRPGRPDTSLVDPAAWRRAWRVAGSAVPGNDAGAGPPHDRLRRVLAEHLRRSRGVAVAPGDLLVVPGVGASLRALPAALGLVGATVALEDPGYVEAWTAFATEGVHVTAVPVDGDGLDPALLPRGAAATYVTPSHQYPLGARMPVTRRVQLLEWARASGALVLEDDYDGEFRYDVSPLPALRSLPGADDHVLYIGTASKLVAPSLRVAWMAPPQRLRDRLRVELESRGLVVNEATGLALAEFVASGALATHHARVTRTYAARRSALVAAMTRHLPGVALEGVDAGLHVVLRLPDDVDDLDVVSRLARRGLATSPLSAYAVMATVRGLVLCYAGLPETQADAAVRVLALEVRDGDSSTSTPGTTHP
jgi:GntR family transcriptional regulator/MocR family aminotransferase